MRDIKFRAWRKDHKSFQYPSLWDSTMPSNWADYYVLEQSTGLHDKNGKEIFEGDVVLVSFGIPRIKSILEVVWRTKKNHDCVANCQHGLDNSITGWWYKDHSNGHDCPMFINDEDFEVIGNIHENQELLK